ncbi:MAG TPA: hypothetical protein VJU81_04260 [Methylomirabilota bacterium]|nr:hypothetical protein [Methylomirabilota bacterium]
MSVMVADDRSEKLPSRVGVARDYNRDVVLVGHASLAAALEDELVSALRARGYRADHLGDTPAADVSVLVRIVRFATDVPALGSVRFQGRSVLVAQATASQAPDSVWADIVDTRDEIVDANLAIPEAGALVERFFRKAATDLAQRVSTGLPPARRES